MGYISIYGFFDIFFKNICFLFIWILIVFIITVTGQHKNCPTLEL